VPPGVGGRTAVAERRMTKLDSAMDRFASALDKLEATINRQVVRAQAAKRLQEEVDTLKEDRAGLAEELDQIKAEARRLNELNERASETLADAIEGIREVLAEA
jgi:DNA repair ATPase RecN